MTESAFEFGDNWKRFSQGIDEARIAAAIASLATLIQTDDLTGRTFLDIGCGSGLSSIAACRMGATVRAFDYDHQSVDAAQANLAQFASEASWLVEQGSVLDADYMASLGTYDVVYSWGVLHHTGDMWKGINMAAKAVAPEGLLALAIYNDQGGASQRWLTVKQIYMRLPKPLKPVLVVFCGLYFEIRAAAIRLVRCENPLPFSDWNKRGSERGMSVWHDLVDWVGGYPFEVAKPEEVFDYLRERGFTLGGLKTCAGGHGCNEFLFIHTGTLSPSRDV